ncbi:MAG: hypothetical protein H8E21_04275 [Gammaproteobacteria bacterium]|nr:hypothetical protein [Gammaproteobacteria bacterium]MBL6999261.1 hypothetical protein [Gammaproteobacteria bacterium]
MLSLEDIMGMCECTEDEIEAIAMHESVPDAIAAELASYLIHSPDGVPRISRIIIEDIEIARSKGNPQQVQKLKEVLMHFIATHPDYSPQETA